MNKALVPRIDTTLELPDGRTLAYAEWTDARATPILFFHGLPMSRLFFPDPATAVDLGVRAITLDRPGIGRSDPQADHRVADWPADVLALADALGIDRFSVIGNSAGVPYALACAALIPQRLTGVAVTNSASAMIYLAREDPEVRAAVLDADDDRIMDLFTSDPAAAAKEAVEVGTEWVAGLAEHPEQLLEGDDDEGDAWFFDDPARRDMFLDGIREAVRQGIDGVAVQWLAQLAPWGFQIEDIEIPVNFWLGATDRITPPPMMRKLTDRIPSQVTTVWEDAGHNGIAKHLRDVLTRICER